MPLNFDILVLAFDTCFWWVWAMRFFVKTFANILNQLTSGSPYPHGPSGNHRRRFRQQSGVQGCPRPSASAAKEDDGFLSDSDDLEGMEDDDIISDSDTESMVGDFTANPAL